MVREVDDEADSLPAYTARSESCQVTLPPGLGGGKVEVKLGRSTLSVTRSRHSLLMCPSPWYQSYSPRVLVIAAIHRAS